MSVTGRAASWARRLTGGATPKGRSGAASGSCFTGSGLGYTSTSPMLWFSIWFLVILKIPIAYLGYVIWWAVKDPPGPSTGPAFGAGESGNGSGGVGGPSRRRV